MYELMPEQGERHGVLVVGTPQPSSWDSENTQSVEQAPTASPGKAGFQASIIQTAARAIRNRRDKRRENYAYSHQETGYDSLEEPDDDGNDGGHSHQIEAKQQLSVRKSRSAFAIWKWEMLALLISVLCMGAIVGILASMKDRLSTAWHVGSITINAAVTGLSTMANMGLAMVVPACLDQEKWRYFKQAGRHQLRHFLLFDQGSRGPIGAAKVIWSVRWPLAVLASFVLILDIVTGFMIQQAVKIEPGYEWSNSSSPPATFSYAQSYETGAYDALDDALTTVDFSMQAAVFRGLSETDWSRSHACSSNCTWPASQSVLGFNSVCNNVTDQTANISQVLLSNWNWSNPVSYPVRFNLTTPSGISIPFEYTYGGANGEVTAAVVRTAALDDSAVVANGSFLRVALFSDDHFGALPYNVGSAAAHLPNEASVVECTLSLVAWNYSAITSDDNNLKIGSRVLMPLSNGVLQPGNEIASNPTNAPAPYVNYTAAKSTFHVNMYNIDRLQRFFGSSAFEGSVSTGWASSGSPSDWGSVPAFLNTSFSDMMDQVASSMTDNLQQGKAAQQAYGLTQVSVNYIRVYWAWVYLPVVVQILALALLASTIICNNRGNGRIPMWKSSRTVLLYHFLSQEGDMLCKLQDLEELEEMEKRVVTVLGY